MKIDRYTFSVLSEGFIEKVDIYASNKDTAFYRLALLEELKGFIYVPEPYIQFYANNGW